MVSFIMPLISVFLIVLVSLFPLFTTFKKEKNDKYTYLNTFVCESGTNYVERLIFFILSVCMVSLTLISYVSNLASVQSSSPLLISSLIFEAISMVGFLGLTVAAMENYKLHLISAMLFFVGQIGANLILGSYYFYNLIIEYQAFNYVDEIGIGTFVIGVIQVILLFNKKLKRWMYMDKTEVNGATYYVRPKVNALASLEWIFLWSQALSLLLLMISSGIIHF